MSNTRANANANHQAMQMHSVALQPLQAINVAVLYKKRALRVSNKHGAVANRRINDPECRQGGSNVSPGHSLQRLTHKLRLQYFIHQFRQVGSSTDCPLLLL